MNGPFQCGKATSHFQGFYQPECYMLVDSVDPRSDCTVCAVWFESTLSTKAT